MKWKVVWKRYGGINRKGVKFLQGSAKTSASVVFDSYIKYVGGSVIVVLVREVRK